MKRQLSQFCPLLAEAGVIELMLNADGSGLGGSPRPGNGPGRLDAARGGGVLHRNRGVHAAQHGHAREPDPRMRAALASPFDGAPSKR